MGDSCSLWFQAVVRGDVHPIRIGNNVNIQDGAVIHVTYWLVWGLLLWMTLLWNPTVSLLPER